MSVLKNHRSLSEYEYEHSFNEQGAYHKSNFKLKRYEPTDVKPIYIDGV